MKNSTLSEFRRPADLPEPEPEKVSMAQLYAWRDAEMFGDKTLQEWRAEIDALLAGGAPYGKSTAAPQPLRRSKLGKRTFETFPRTRRLSRFTGWRLKRRSLSLATSRLSFSAAGRLCFYSR